MRAQMFSYETMNIFTSSSEMHCQQQLPLQKMCMSPQMPPGSGKRNCSLSRDHMLRNEIAKLILRLRTLTLMCEACSTPWNHSL